MHEGNTSETLLSPPPRSHHRARWYAWVAGGCIGLCFLLVIGCALLGGAISGLIYTFANQKEATATATHTLAVSGMPTLDVTNAAGSITVERGTAEQVKVVYSKRAHDVSQRDAQRALDAMIVSISQTGNTITVKVRSPTAASMEAFGSQHSVDLTLDVPAVTSLQLRQMAGNVRVSDVSGTLMVNVQAGNVDLRNVSLAGSSSVRLGAGNVTLDGSLQNGSALEMRVATGNVDVALPPDAAVHITADTALGDVTAAGWPITTTHSGTGASATGDTSVKPTSILAIHVDTGRISVGMRG
ncbi:MAG TPA: DUF4097 family beta strand repeat-containing protein [Ktedonobacterales bacterium]